MTVQALAIEDFRCLEKVEVEAHPDTNLIVGDNASGKTSFLEALFFLGRGRSFRTARARGLVRDGARNFLVRAELEGRPGRLGVQSGADGLKIRVDGQPAQGIEHLVSAVPVQVIEPGIHRLVEAGPAQRRAFLDWGVFHVKQSFLEEWRRFQRAVRQRNAALRGGADRAGAGVWEDALVAAGEAVHTLRRTYLDLLRPHLTPITDRLLEAPVRLNYTRGWPEDATLAEALDQSWERDRRLGLTNAGPHRADLQLRFADKAARARVSRGQQKLLASALVLAQLALFHGERAQRAVLLLDDPGAELDRHSLSRLFAVIEGLPAQAFITGLTAAELPADRPHSMFHVEQGRFEKMV